MNPLLYISMEEMKVAHSDISVFVFSGVYMCV